MFIRASKCHNTFCTCGDSRYTVGPAYFKEDAIVKFNEVAQDVQRSVLSGWIMF
jgi:hypothetical protein